MFLADPGLQNGRPVRERPAVQDQFSIDFDTGRLTCPAGASMPFEPGKAVRFPKGACAACPLRQRCITSGSGRCVSIHPDEALFAELRRCQQTPQGREELRERVAVVHNLHIIARQPVSMVTS